MEQSVGIATALCPYIGYKKSAEIAKQALAENKSVREIVVNERLVRESQVDRILDPVRMTELPDQRGSSTKPAGRQSA
jgi:aspartate ammonia-lyase